MIVEHAKVNTENMNFGAYRQSVAGAELWIGPAPNRSAQAIIKNNLNIN